MNFTRRVLAVSCILVLALGVPLPTTSRAAEAHPQGQLALGVQGGLNLSRFSSDLVTDSKAHARFQGGCTASVALGQGLWIRSGLLLRGNGGKEETRVFGTDEEGNPTDCVMTTYWSFQYLTLPLLASYSIGTSPLQPYLNLGPEISILLSAKQKDEFSEDCGPSGQGWSQETDIKDRLEDLDLDLLLGGGVRYHFGRVAPFLEVAYALGLIDAYKDLDAKNSNFTILLGVELYP